MRPRMLVLVLAGAIAAGLAAGPAVAFPPPPGPDRPEIAPPPAWIETERGAFWLAYSSFCWSTRTGGICADYIDPHMRKDLPVLRVRRGETVRVHLEVVPWELFVSVRDRQVRVERSRIFDIRVRRDGLLLVSYFHKKGDGNFAARLAVR